MLVPSIFSFSPNFSYLMEDKLNILDSSKLKEIADDYLKFDENGGMLSKRVENAFSNFSFSPQSFLKTWIGDM